MRNLDDLAFSLSDDSWIWKDDMIVFPRDDGFYNEEDRRAELLHQLATETHRMIWDDDEDHPICGEFPHDSIVAPRGWDKVD